MEAAFWIVIVFALIYEPVIGCFGFMRFKGRLESKNSGRVRRDYYWNTIAGLCAPAAFILGIVAFSPLSLKNIGLGLPDIDTNTLGPLITYIGFALTALYALILIYYLVAYRFSEKFRIQFAKAKEQQLNQTAYSEILPVTKPEKKLWNVVSLTAGVTEEIIYRGFLIYAVAFLLPGLSVWIVMLISSLLFGLAHTYQGVSGVVKTTVIGFLFSMIYIGLGSLWPLILLHFLRENKKEETLVPSEIFDRAGVFL